MQSYIKFATQTLGEKARRLLNQNGFSASLKRNPNPNHKEGCNYALFVRGNMQRAFHLIEQSGIPNLGMETFRDGA